MPGVGIPILYGERLMQLHPFTADSHLAHAPACSASEPRRSATRTWRAPRAAPDLLQPRSGRSPLGGSGCQQRRSALLDDLMLDEEVFRDGFAGHVEQVIVVGEEQHLGSAGNL